MATNCNTAIGQAIGQAISRLLLPEEAQQTQRQNSKAPKPKPSCLMRQADSPVKMRCFTG